MVRLLLGTALFSLAVLFACGPTQPPRKCTAESCKGCCTIQDRCEEGSTKAACGVGGVVCNVCNDTDYCRNGNCTSEPPCKNIGGSCTINEHCCVGLICANGSCSGGSGGCKSSGLSCNVNADCCSNFCRNGICENQCGGLNGSCIPCCEPGLTCINQQCQPAGGTGGGGSAGCAPLNQPCSAVIICCSGHTCQQGVCRP